MKRGWVPTAAAKQAEANRVAREVTFWASPMAFWDKVFSGGAMARELAIPIVPNEVSRAMKLDELKAVLRDQTGSHEALAAAVRRWTPAPRKEGEQFAEGGRALKALDGSDLIQYPPEHVERMQKEARRALHSAEGVANVELGRLVADVAKEPNIRFQQGTPLDGEHRGEVPLFLEEFRGRTRQEQADLLARGHQALANGDLQTALAVKRAKDILRLDDGEFDDSLAKADPIRQEAKAELDAIQSLVETWQGDVARRHVVSGMPGDGDTVAMIDAAARLGVSQDGSGGSFVQAAVGQ